MYLSRTTSASRCLPSSDLMFRHSRAQAPASQDERRVRRSASWPWKLALLFCVAAASACRNQDNAEVIEVQEQELRYHSIPDTPLEIRLPDEWTIDKLRSDEPSSPPSSAAEDIASPPRETDRIELQSQTMFSARAPTGALGEVGRPWLMVLHDPGLPKHISPSLYLRAQRASNQGATRLQHVETEQTQRSGRSGFYLRDAFEVPLGSVRKTMSQQSLLVLDTEPPIPSGYAVVITALEEDRSQNEALFRAILKSVRFRKSP